MPWKKASPTLMGDGFWV